MSPLSLVSCFCILNALSYLLVTGMKNCSNGPFSCSGWWESWFAVFCLSSNWCVMYIPAASSSSCTLAAFYLMTTFVNLLGRVNIFFSFLSKSWSSCAYPRSSKLIDLVWVSSHPNTSSWMTKRCQLASIRESREMFSINAESFVCLWLQDYGWDIRFLSCGFGLKSRQQRFKLFWLCFW